MTGLSQSSVWRHVESAALHSAVVVVIWPHGWVHPPGTLCHCDPGPPPEQARALWCPLHKLSSQLVPFVDAAGQVRAGTTRARAPGGLPRLLSGLRGEACSTSLSPRPCPCQRSLGPVAPVVLSLLTSRPMPDLPVGHCFCFLGVGAILSCSEPLLPGRPCFFLQYFLSPECVFLLLIPTR